MNRVQCESEPNEGATISGVPRLIDHSPGLLQCESGLNSDANGEIFLIFLCTHSHSEECSVHCFYCLIFSCFTFHSPAQK